jgi:tRNA-Thr(GGU) m(6)t(6)A37 methyltransferase TsaA
VTDVLGRAVAVVVGGRQEILDDDWGDVTSIVRLEDAFTTDALAGLEGFSHVEVVFCFDRVAENRIETGARHPRGRADWPLVGIFAQRGKNRPNRLGVSRAELLRIEGRDLHVRGLDALDGTPVLDIKPVMREFEPRGEVHQPEWATELMQGYY